MKTLLYYVVFLLLFMLLWQTIGTHLSTTRVVLVSLAIGLFRLHRVWGVKNGFNV